MRYVKILQKILFYTRCNLQRAIFIMLRPVNHDSTNNDRIRDTKAESERLYVSRRMNGARKKI